MPPPVTPRNYLFARLRRELTAAGIAKRSKEARDWFTARVRALNGRIARQPLLNDPVVKAKKTPLWGFMYMFVYDAKHKATLPYWDRFPLVLMIEPAPGGFYGLNLHYLRPKIRAIFLDKLMETLGNKALDDHTRLRLRYSLLSKAKKFREFRPCFKHYLTKHITSKIAEVPATEWDIANFLPAEHFIGAQKEEVWKESTKEYSSH